MKILDRYLVFAFLRNFFVVIAIVSTLLLISEIIDTLGDMLENDTPINVAATYLLCTLPYKLVQVTPIASIVAVLFTIGAYARNNEILAMLTGGVSLYRIAAPLLIAGFLISVGTFLLAEQIASRTEREARQLKRIHIEGKTPRNRNSDIVASGMDNSSYAINNFRYDENGEVMQIVTIWKTDPTDWILESRLDASSARYIGEDAAGNTIWEFSGAKETTFDFKGNLEETIIHTAPIQRTLNPKLNVYLRYPLKPEEMNFLQLRDYSATLGARGVITAPYDTEFWIKIAHPLASFLLVLVGFSCAMEAQRGSVVLGFGMGLFFTLFYFIFAATMRAFGHAGLWGEAWIFAWAPAMIALVVGVFLITRAARSRYITSLLQGIPGFN